MGKLANWLQLPLVLLASAAVAAELEPKTIRDFSAGLVTDADSTLIPDGAAQDLANVDVEDGSIRKRYGSIKTNSSAIGTGQSVRLLHAFTDASSTFWMLAVSSNTIYTSNDGGATWSIGTSGLGVSATTRFQVANAFSTAYFVSESTNVIEFNGTAFSQNTAAPLGSAVALFADRLWISQNSILYGSRVSDDTDWTDNGTDDADAFSATVRNNDGYTIRALANFGPDLLIFKDYSIDRLVINSDGLTFSLFPVTSHLGTQYPETVKVADNRIIWLAHDGVYSYDGSTIKRISEKIQPTFDGLAQLSAAGRSYIESTASQFTSGTSSGTSAGVVSDSVVLSTWTATDTSASDFAAGTLTNVTTQTVSGDLYLSTTTTAYPNGGIENGTGTDADNWGEITGASRVANPGSLLAGSWAMRLIEGTWSGGFNTGVLRVKLIGSSGSEIATLHTESLAGSYFTPQTENISLAAYAGRNCKVRIEAQGTFSGSPTISYAETSLVLLLGGNLTFSWVSYNQLSTVSLWYDSVSFNYSAITSGTIVSAVYDTQMENGPLWLPSTPSYTTNGHTITFDTQTSSDSVVWSTTTSWTPGQAPTSPSARYIRYRANIVASDSGTTWPFISDITLSARHCAGRYKSSHATLTGITSWGVFGVNDVLNGGAITYEIYTDTDTTMPLVSGVPTQFVSSQTITNGGTPTVSTAAYAVVCATFSITAATQAPQMDDFTLRWNEGDSTLYPAGMFWNQRYHLALSVNSSSENDELFIYDKNGAWTRYTGFSIGSLSLYRTRPYLGTTDGYVVRIHESDRYRDYDDAAIDAYWVSKDFDLGYPITSKSLVRYYLTGNYATLGSLTFGYGIERGSLTSSTYAQTQTGFWRQTVKPSSLTYSEGIQHRFRFSNSTLDSPMSVLSITGRWNLNTNP